MRMIDADALKEKIDSMWNGRPLSSLGARILVTIDEAPTIDADRPQGEWIETSEGTICGNCGASPYDDGEYRIANWHSNYCPHCGVPMKGADDE